MYHFLRPLAASVVFTAALSLPFAFEAALPRLLLAVADDSFEAMLAVLPTLCICCMATRLLTAVLNLFLLFPVSGLVGEAASADVLPLAGVSGSDRSDRVGLFQGATSRLTEDSYTFRVALLV